MRAILLCASIAVISGPALAAGPRTPIEAFQRLQGSSLTRHAPNVNRTNRRLLRTPTGRNVLRGSANRRLVVETGKKAAKRTRVKAQQSWIKTVFTSLKNLLR